MTPGRFKLWLRNWPLVGVALFLSSCVTTGRTAQPVTSVVFAIERGGDFFYLWPILVYSRGVYMEPPCEPDESEVSNLIKEHLRIGRTHAIVSGNRRVGTATVIGAPDTSNDNCLAMQSSVRLTLERSVSLGTAEAVLSVPESFAREVPRELSRFSLGDRLHHRSGPLYEALIRVGIPAMIVGKLKVSGHFIDLYGDGEYQAVIEAFTEFDEVEDSEKRHDVFIVQRWGRKAFETIFADHRSAHGPGGDFCRTRLLDILDIDGDGVMEIFVRLECYEGVAYGVYKSDGGTWRRVYAGAYHGL